MRSYLGARGIYLYIGGELGIMSQGMSRMRKEGDSDTQNNKCKMSNQFDMYASTPRYFEQPIQT